LADCNQRPNYVASQFQLRVLIMIDVRPFESLGAMNIGWLDARYHFSFADYHDPDRVHWGALRVWNDDTIKPGTGFQRHGHRDMEIITYVRKGAITHRDHLGNQGRTEAGDVQVMSAGTGIMHEEQNIEATDTQIFQLWILPKLLGVKPGWASAKFPKGERAGRLVTLASGKAGDGFGSPNDGALTIHQDAAVLGATLNQGQEIRHALDPARHYYLVPAVGALTVNGHAVKARDGVAISGESELVLKASADAEILLVDAP
jgi:quercetin 2,3-dioxygenase